MKYIRIKRLANMTISYQLIRRADHTDILLLEGSLYCPDSNNLFVTDFLNDEYCPYLKEDGYLELLIDSEYDVFSSNVHKSYNDALKVIRDAILNLYSNLLVR